ncbi:MAG: Asp23/Gls24 family envelope stress response protein [Gaiellaceae bacterium]
MERQYDVVASSRGRIAVSSGAIEQIVGYAAAESYGVVALAGSSRWTRLLPWGIRKGVDVSRSDDGLAIELRIVVERGLRLSEVATAVRSRVLYELDRMVGMPVAALEVRIDGVRGRR